MIGFYPGDWGLPCFRLAPFTRDLYYWSYRISTVTYLMCMAISNPYTRCSVGLILGRWRVRIWWWQPIK